MLDVQRSTRRGEWATAERGCHPLEVRAEQFRQLWLLEQPEPRVPHRKVPSKPAVLVRIRFSCSYKGPPKSVADRKVCISLLLGLEAHSPDWSGRAAPGSPSP